MKTAYVISTVAITTNIIPLGTKYNSYIIPTTYVQSIAATDNTCSVGRTRRRRLRKRCRCRHSKKFFGMSCIGEGRLAELDKWDTVHPALNCLSLREAIKKPYWENFACQKTNEWNLSQLEASIGLQIKNVTQMQFISMTFNFYYGQFLVCSFRPAKWKWQMGTNVKRLSPYTIIYNTTKHLEGITKTAGRQKPTKTKKTPKTLERHRNNATIENNQRHNWNKITLESQCQYRAMEWRRIDCPLLTRENIGSTSAFFLNRRSKNRKPQSRRSLPSCPRQCLSPMSGRMRVQLKKRVLPSHPLLPETFLA